MIILCGIRSGESWHTNRIRPEYDAIASTRTNGDDRKAAGSRLRHLTYGRRGEYVEVDKPLAVVSGNRKMSLRAEVPQRYYAELATIRSANFTVPATAGYTRSRRWAAGWFCRALGQRGKQPYTGHLSSSTTRRTFPGAAMRRYGSPERPGRPISSCP